MIVDCQVMVVAPLLFQTAFNFASNPPVSSRSPRLCGLAPMGSRRFTKSPGMSPPDGSSLLPDLCRFWALATALAVPAYAGPSRSGRRELPQLALRLPSAVLHLLASRCSIGILYGCCEGFEYNVATNIRNGEKWEKDDGKGPSDLAVRW